MKERPILMAGPLVIATMEGRKTQTRRVVNPQPIFGCDVEGLRRRFINEQDHIWICEVQRPDQDRWMPSEYYKCPYGVPGDRLWVLEATRKVGDWGSAFSADGNPVLCTNLLTREAMPAVWPNPKRLTRPPMHMRRDWCRLILEVTDIRVERVQDISERDAIAEGIEQSSHTSPRYRFERLWDNINADRKDKDGNRLPYAWKDNPFIWVISYKMLEENDV